MQARPFRALAAALVAATLAPGSVLGGQDTSDWRARGMLAPPTSGVFEVSFTGSAITLQEQADFASNLSVAVAGMAAVNSTRLALLSVRPVPHSVGGQASYSAVVRMEIRAAEFAGVTSVAAALRVGPFFATHSVRPPLLLARAG
jgi:hypothetical protein|eukprot:SAG25_NODE_1656_length_2598_cov_1.890356_2_plen_145_part_00